MHDDTDPSANDCQAESTDSRYGSVCNQCCDSTKCTYEPEIGTFTFDGNTSNAEWAAKLINVFHNN